MQQKCEFRHIRPVQFMVVLG